mmetsp:Transcript_46908/g.60284  ORF Transcript_46908/g.60284 Transcript_46908/m.60284 type:complete len:89 (-) Transcript_46908:1374-1640(-)
MNIDVWDNNGISELLGCKDGHDHTNEDESQREKDYGEASCELCGGHEVAKPDSADGGGQEVGPVDPAEALQVANKSPEQRVAEQDEER